MSGTLLAEMADQDQGTEQPERIRLIIDTTEARRRAVWLRAILVGGSASDVVNGLIDTHLASELRQVAEQMPTKESPTKRRRRPRPPQP